MPPVYPRPYLPADRQASRGILAHTNKISLPREIQNQRRGRSSGKTNQGVEEEEKVQLDKIW